MNLTNKIAVISGGASGIGYACVQKMQQEKIKTIIWDKQKPHILPEACKYIICDVTSEEGLTSAMEKTIAEVGIPQICINCAGVAPAKKIFGKKGPMPLIDFKKVIDINLIGTFNVMRVVVEAMLKVDLAENEERGIIINTASIAAFDGQIGQTAYSASKGGIVALTLPAARELAQHNIRVNTIAPGLFATPLLENMSDNVKENLSKQFIYPKRFGSPCEYADLALHMIKNQMINGAVFRLDGALRMQA